MNITKKIALGLGGGAIVLGSTFGMASLASAETPDPTPAQTQTQAGNQNRFGNADGVRQQTNENAGLRNGAGYGAQAGIAQLAQDLGVSQDALRDALVAFRADNPAVRGADLSADERATHHAELAAFLADELDLDKDKVLAALDARAENRPANAGQGMGQGKGMGQGVRDGSGPRC